MIAECVLGILESVAAMKNTIGNYKSLLYLPVRLFLSPVGSLRGTSLLEYLFDAFDGCSAGHRPCTEINDTSRTSV